MSPSGPGGVGAEKAGQGGDAARGDADRAAGADAGEPPYRCRPCRVWLSGPPIRRRPPFGGRRTTLETMAFWYESSIDRQLREAQERGEFDNLPGPGKPLADAGREYEEDWWIRSWLEREGASAAVLPAGLQLRRDAEDLAKLDDRRTTEKAVRELVAAVNE